MKFVPVDKFRGTQIFKEAPDAAEAVIVVHFKAGGGKAPKAFAIVPVQLVTRSRPSLTGSRMCHEVEIQARIFLTDSVIPSGVKNAFVLLEELCSTLFCILFKA